MKNGIKKCITEINGRDFVCRRCNKIFTPEETSLGVRCQREFTGKYLYPKKRVYEHHDKIADYVVFFNHLGCHIFYIIGIVEKDFLVKPGPNPRGPLMETFSFPERSLATTRDEYGSDYSGKPIEEVKAEVRGALKKRIRERRIMEKRKKILLKKVC